MKKLSLISLNEIELSSIKGGENGKCCCTCTCTCTTTTSFDSAENRATTYNNAYNGDRSSESNPMNPNNL